MSNINFLDMPRIIDSIPFSSIGAGDPIAMALREAFVSAYGLAAVLARYQTVVSPAKYQVPVFLEKLAPYATSSQKLDIGDATTETPDTTPPLLANFPVIPGSIYITAGDQVIGPDVSAGATGTIGGVTITYATGVFSGGVGFTFPLAVAATTNVVASYQWDALSPSNTHSFHAVLESAKTDLGNAAQKIRGLFEMSGATDATA